METETAAKIVAASQALGSLGQQMPREILRSFGGAQLRFEHMLMAHALGEPGGRRLDIDAMSIWWNSNPLMPPQIRRSWNGVASHNWATVEIPARLRRCSMRVPLAVANLQAERGSSLGTFIPHVIGAMT